MAGPNWSSPSASASSSSSHRRDSGAASLSAAAAASSSGSSSQVREEEEERDREYPGQHHFHNPELENHHIGGLLSYRENLPAFDDDSPRMIRDDTWSCIIVVFTFLFFVSVTLILGVYGAVNIQFGPNCSLLIQPNPLFVQSVKVEEIDDSKPGLKLYGLYKSPYLDVVTTWSENYTATVQADSHMEWIHYLNRGSQVNISYNVNSASSSVFLVIAQGREGLSRWLEDPTYPNTTLSWNIVDGSGMIELVIYRSSSYYVALGNLNSEDIEVELNLTVRAYIYNTTEAYYRCTFANGVCSLSILFPQGNSIVLTSPGPEQHSSANDWSVRVSYGPRWITYIVGIGGMTAIMLVAFNFLNKFQFTRGDEASVRYREFASARTPLLSRKADDVSSWGSSYDSISSDEADLEDFLTGSVEGTSIGDGENSNNTKRLCAICFDAPRECFFLPCGHCVACFACGTRLAEAGGTCPICRRNMRKVRKIFTV
ncbi:E3 ubiquitin-protein ligase APD2-like [Hibiscus syriacus]|uniref:E3 ubiquitin-protein ligase APD2-like n=1 Tax=Hibiscus syriacus TaxID=106335 RepID=UPI0019219584|nr:E3 ubiquitin-protein ligase APD2-like [Hibiscus syriacus]